MHRPGCFSGETVAMTHHFPENFFQKLIVKILYYYIFETNKCIFINFTAFKFNLLSLIVASVKHLVLEIDTNPIKIIKVLKKTILFAPIANTINVNYDF